MDLSTGAFIIGAIAGFLTAMCLVYDPRAKQNAAIVSDISGQLNNPANVCRSVELVIEERNRLREKYKQLLRG